MCGASTFASDWMAADPCSRRLMRNISSNSSLANNTGSSQSKDDAAGLDDRSSLNIRSSLHDIITNDAWDNSVSCVDAGLAAGGACTSVAECSFDSIRPHLGCAQVPAPQVDMQPESQHVFIGTSGGLYQLDLDALQMQQIALHSVAVAFVSYSSHGLVLAACPAPDEDPYNMSHSVAEAKEAAGLYCIDMKQECSSSCLLPATKLWQGGATCCAFAPMEPCCSNEQAAPRIYLGTQPANLVCSDDFGGSWSSCDLSKAPQSDSWFRRLPPYEPSVRAINFSRSASTADQQQQPELMVAVEVGGVLCSNQQMPQQHDRVWRDCSQGLCKDVHALQADPFNPRVLYAVAGSGHLPGGLYRCKGHKWKRLFGYRYAVCMAVSAYQKGRMLLVSADKPPATGCILFESVDAGRTWVNISDDVADAAAVLTEHAPEVFDQAPLTMFVPGGLVVACATGHVFHGTARLPGGYSAWKLIGILPASVNCMCSTDTAVAPVAIPRH